MIFSLARKKKKRKENKKEERGKRKGAPHRPTIRSRTTLPVCPGFRDTFALQFCYSPSLFHFALERGEERGEGEEKEEKKKKEEGKQKRKDPAVVCAGQSFLKKKKESEITIGNDLRLRDSNFYLSIFGREKGKEGKKKNGDEKGSRAQPCHSPWLILPTDIEKKGGGKGGKGGKNREKE